MEYTPGAQGHNSNLMPSMLNSTAEKFIVDNNIDDKLDAVAFSNEIRQFYKRFSSSTQEIYISGWTFFSLDNIIQMCEKYKKDGIKTVDLAFRYLGMGHVKVAFYHPKYDTILYRHDGGSSYHDRNYFFKEFKEFDLEKFADGISFKKFLENIKTATNDIEEY